MKTGRQKKVNWQMDGKDKHRKRGRVYEDVQARERRNSEGGENGMPLVNARSPAYII